VVAAATQPRRRVVASRHFDWPAAATARLWNCQLQSACRHGLQRSARMMVHLMCRGAITY
jgi:hypothetical protein